MIRKLTYLMILCSLILLVFCIILKVKLLFIFLTVFVLLTGLLIFTFGIVRVSLSFFSNNICQIPLTGSFVALTFDDGPDTQTERILEILEIYNAKASFFCIGQKAEKNPDLLLRIHNSGHSIGSHTYTHNWKYTLSPYTTVKTEIKNGADAISKITGKKTILFRPPFGITNPVIGQVIKNCGLTSIGWNIRTFDTLCKDKNVIKKRIIKNLRPGAIILMHDRIKPSVDILPEILEEIKYRGLTPVSLEIALNKYLYV